MQLKLGLGLWQWQWQWQWHDNENDQKETRLSINQIPSGQVRPACPAQDGPKLSYQKKLYFPRRRVEPGSLLPLPFPPWSKVHPVLHS